MEAKNATGIYWVRYHIPYLEHVTCKLATTIHLKGVLNLPPVFLNPLAGSEAVRLRT